MASYLETPDVRVLLDAGCSLGHRSGLPPHPLEYRALKEARERIRRFSEGCDIVTISHYHFDHYTAAWSNLEAMWSWSSREEAQAIYSGKEVYAKDYRDNINPSQRRRGYIFQKIVGEFSKKMLFSDSKRMKRGRTEIAFTRPLPHGEEHSGLGFVVGLMVRHGSSSILFAPDVQGPIADATLAYILRKAPEILVVGGPPTYLSGSKVAKSSIESGIQNLRKLCSSMPTIVLDHHLLRGEEGAAVVESLREHARSRGNRLTTMAEYLGDQNRILEARRRLLYEEQPPSREFQAWMKLPLQRQRLQPPPL